MFDPVLRELLQPLRARLITELKRSDGLSVSQLAELLDMSYMGVKQHCDKLEKGKFLKVWRVPRKMAGRPEKLYQLTSKCDPLFPQGDANLSVRLLASVADALGATAPEKVLFRFFTRLKVEWEDDVRKGKSLVEKATRLTALRDKLGVFSRCQFDREMGFRIEEYHHPYRSIFEAYPTAEGMELRMLEELLGTKVTRTVVESERGSRLVILEVRTL